QLFGLYPRKGSIIKGADADLVIWDPLAKRTISAATHHHNCDYSIFEGYQTMGAPTWVIANGKIRYDEGNVLVEQGAGRYISRSLPRF
ncbi:amidohydrolase family protein, partial [bacterium]|nr:amidohydrolase family protein [bacterium]